MSLLFYHKISVRNLTLVCCSDSFDLTHRFGINTAVVQAPIENFFISTILYLLAL